MFQRFWDKLIGEAKGYLAALDSRYSGGTRIADDLLPGLPAMFRSSSGLASYRLDEIDKFATRAALDLRIRNDSVNHDIDWITIFDGQNAEAFPIEGTLSCVTESRSATGVCTYDGKILRGISRDAAPKPNDVVKMSVSGKGAHGAIFVGSDLARTRLGLVFVPESPR